MKTALRLLGIIILAVVFYINGEHPIEYIFAFIALMSLVFWGIPAVVCWIFGLNKTKYDGVIYIQTMSDDSTDLKLDIYDKPSILTKTELLIKCDIPDILKEDSDETKNEG